MNRSGVRVVLSGAGVLAWLSLYLVLARSRSVLEPLDRDALPDDATARTGVWRAISMGVDPFKTRVPATDRRQAPTTA